MIKINRSLAPDFLSKPNRKWQKENQRALLHYSGGANVKPFDFKSYRDKNLKAKLKEVFPKCAYCETIYDAGSDGDVEHFRPKLSVVGKTPQTPGYYWLANNWDNLFLSCSHCNQGRMHNVYDPVSGRVIESPVSLGKVDQFPMKSPGIWNQGPNQNLADEEPHRLLINPCLDDPEQHFDYHEELVIMIPKTEMAQVSINVFALSRSILVDRRRQVKETLFMLLELLRKEFEDFNINRCDASRVKIKMLWKLISEMTDRKAQYAGMCIYFKNRFLSANNIQL